MFVDDVLSGGFQEVEGLSGSGEENLFDKIMSALRKLLGLRKLTNITLKRGLVADRTLNDWYRNVQAGHADRRAVVIKRTDASIHGEWRIRGARPAKIEGPCLKATANDVAIDSLELTHDGVATVRRCGTSRDPASQRY